MNISPLGGRLIVSSQLYFTINREEIFYFINKKCRIYAAFGVSQTPKKYVDVEELTQTIVNEYIKKIVVYAPDKSNGKRTQKVKIYFNFVDDVDIPVISEPITTETTYGPRKTA